MTSDLLKNYIKPSLGPEVLSKVAPFLLSVPAAVTVDLVVPRSLRSSGTAPGSFRWTLGRHPLPLCCLLPISM